MKNLTINLEQKDYNVEKSYNHVVKSDSQKYNFTYYKKRDLPEEYEIIGYVDFKKLPNSDDTYAIKGISEKGTTTFFKVLDEKKKLKRVKGFIHVGNNQFLGIQSMLLIPIILLFLLGIILLLSLLLTGKPDDTDNTDQTKESWVIGGESGTDIDLDSNNAEITYNTYLGYQEITIYEDMCVPFVNKEENTYYAKFTVYDKDGNPLYVSDLIIPGTHTSWDAYSYYGGESGEYLHDLYVQFYKPIVDSNNKNKIIDFEVTMVSACTPDFKIIIK